MSLKLCYFGDPVLRKKAKAIQTVTDEIKQFADQLVQKMLQADGIGLAATQVGVLWRMFASVVYQDQEDGQFTYGDPYVVINPVIHHHSEEMCEMQEGCLSIPGLYTGPVPRPYSIDVSWMTLEGKSMRQTLQGFMARNWMHEIDHLNGVLFIDRIKGKAKRSLEPELRRIKNTYYLKENVC